MKLSEKIKLFDFKGRDFPLIAGTVKFKLHNVHNGKDEVYEEHNMVTNALADMFTNNYGGLINYQVFENLYNTWLGGVLLFQNQLDVSEGSESNYAIPDCATNPVMAHAGQIPIGQAPYDQSDDLTRGNPDSTGTVCSVNSTKLRWEWGTSAGNGNIASLGLTHSDVGSYGCASKPDHSYSQCLSLLNPFVALGNMTRGGTNADNLNTAFAINGNTVYKFYLSDTSTVHIHKAPINNTKYKLQGGALLPITDYTQTVSATLPNAYRTTASCYFHFDFANNKLILFGVPSANQSNLYRDDIDLTNGTVTHQTITVTGVPLWDFRTSTRSGYGWGQDMLVPTKAIILNNYLYVFGIEYVLSGYHPMKMYKINLSNTTDVVEIDTTLLTVDNRLDGEDCSATACLVTPIGNKVVHQCYIIDSDVYYPLSLSKPSRSNLYSYAIPDSHSSPVFSTSNSLNVIYASKLYLATKWNLPQSVTKTSSQVMTVEYTLQEV